MIQQDLTQFLNPC